MKVVAIVPARSGSKGVPDKNIRPLAGRPLIAFSIRAALRSPNIDRILVSTDSEEYARIAREFGAEVPFLRPVDISADMSTDLDFFRHALNWLQSHEGQVPELFVHLRPTTPLRDPQIVSKAVEVMKLSPASTALRSVHEMPESAYKTFEISGEWLKSVGSGSFALDAANNARQQFPKTYHANGYVDVVRSSMIMEHNKLHGDKVHAFVTPPVAEIDTLEDLDYLQYQAERNPAWVEKLFRE
jgi:CMP-N,N'-diacetyllegionaminic acid synthase